jgi:diguanylate cyclase (GGDEF)-like protein/PAS domain S-box-containing protein
MTMRNTINFGRLVSARPGLLVLLPAFALMLVALTWTATYLRIRDDQTLTTQYVVAQGAALARAEEERAARLFRQIDQIARFLTVQFETNGGLGRISASLQRADLLPADVAIGVAIADTTGRIVASDHAPNLAISIADRDYFKALASNGSSDLYIGEPLRHKATDRWVVPAARRLNLPDGSFAGVVIIWVDPAYFTNFFDAATLGPTGSVSLLGTDGVFRARRVGDHVEYGDRLNFPNWRERLGWRSAGTFTVESVFDHERRVFSYRRVAEFPLVVVLGVPEAYAYAGFNRRRDANLVFTTLVSVLIVAFAAVLTAQGLRLKRQENQLRAITDHLPVLISYVDADQRFKFANRAYKEWLDIEPAALLGRSLCEVYGESAYQQFRSHIERALRGEQVNYGREFDSARGRRHVQVALVPDSRGDGKVAGLHVLIVDMTEQKRAEYSLRQSEQRMRVITDALPMRIAYVDAEERYRFNNLAYERTFGARPDAIYGKTIREFMGEEIYKDFEPWVRRALKGETVTFSNELVTVDAVRNYEATYIPQFDEDGATVLGFHAVVTDVTTIKREERRLLQITQLDPLTGVANRVGLRNELERAMEQSRGTGALTGIMYLDVDRFKQINDTYGHAAGDELLKEFAKRLVRTLRLSDTVGRLGGDEFAILLERLHAPEQITAVADKILFAMQEPFELDNERVAVTTSIGLALYDGDARNPEALLELADKNLYQAKAAGRNTWRGSIALAEGQRV